MIAPRKPKKPHPAEIAAKASAIEAIRNADHFVASLFVGRGEYAIKSAPTVIRAIERARELEKDSRAFTRRATISAVGKDGRATLLTDTLMNQLLTAAIAAGWKL